MKTVYVFLLSFALINSNLNGQSVLKEKIFVSVGGAYYLFNNSTFNTIYGTKFVPTRSITLGFPFSSNSNFCFSMSLSHSTGVPEYIYFSINNGITSITSIRKGSSEFDMYRFSATLLNNVTIGENLQIGYNIGISYNNNNRKDFLEGKTVLLVRNVERAVQFDILIEKGIMNTGIGLFAGTGFNRIFLENRLSAKRYDFNFFGGVKYYVRK